MKIPSHAITAALMILMSSALAAQPSGEGMTMDGGMMMSGWFMLLCIALAVLLFVALILAIMALFKYLFGRKA